MKEEQLIPAAVVIEQMEKTHERICEIVHRSSSISQTEKDSLCADLRAILDEILPKRGP